MRKKNLMKRGLALALSTAMVLGMMPSMGDNLKEVQAAENQAPTPEYWTEPAGLMNFKLASSSDSVGKIIFGQNGSGGAQEWKIAGTDSEIAGDNIILFADTPLGNTYFEKDFNNNKKYDSAWDCKYTVDMTDKEVYPNHYGSSYLRSTLNDYLNSTSYFSSPEVTKMNSTTIYTNDQNNKDANSNPLCYATTDKLYVPYGDNSRSYDTYVTVGTNSSDSLNGALRIDYSHWKDMNTSFWLRAPQDNYTIYVLTANTYIGFASPYDVSFSYSVVPAFDLNLSSVIFASAANAASSSYSGFKANSDMAENTYTLRYKADEQEKARAVFSPDGDKVQVTQANGEYLMVQNSIGVYAMAIDSDFKIIEANAIRMGSTDADKLEDFNDCKVWIESTEDRITTAKLAEQGSLSVSISTGANMSKTSESGGSTQFAVNGSQAITDVVYTADDGYYFPSDYADSVASVNGISVTRNSVSQITVSGTPSADVEISLTAATAKTAVDAPNIEIDFEKEELTGFDTSTEYSINDGAAFTPSESTMAIDSNYFGKTISIKRTETDTEAESEEESLEIPSRPSAPSVTGHNENVVGKGDGSITGVDSNMKYSTNQTDWISCEGNTIPNLTAGTFYVRKEATDSSFRSEFAEVIIGSNAEKKIALTVTALAFATVTEGYTGPTGPDAKKITIKNAATANWDATVSGVTLTGTDAESFTFSGSGYDWTVQPIAGLTANTNGTAKTYTATINVAYNATTGVTSPATADVSFTVNPKSNTVTVTNGTGSATYNKGATVTATASTAKEGWEFEKWTGIDGLALLEGTTSASKTIKFTMPENEVNITAKYKDVNPPTIEIKEGTNIINKILNPLTFGKFFKDTKTFSIDYIDDESGIDTKQYCVSAKLLSETELDSATWTDYTDKFNIDAKNKNVIYAKAVDKDGNVTIVNSDGVVVYTDSAQDTKALTFIKNVTGDLDATVTLNGNTIKEIKNGDTSLTNEDYSVDGNKITFNNSFLSTLSDGDTTLTISYHPMGEAYQDITGNEKPNDTAITVTVRKPKLNSITTPSPVTVANGTALDATELGLPGSVTISTEDATVTTADVTTWDLENLVEGTYNPETLTEQTFKVRGTVNLSNKIDAGDNPLTVTIQVTVSAAGIVGAPIATPAPGIYTENQTVALSSSTEGATIYYTTDGTEPSVEDHNGAEYTGALLINGSEGQTVQKTVKAIAVKDGMQTSDVSTLEYTIKIPGIVYEITKGAGSTYQLNTTGTITITCTGELSKLTGIYVDDKLVDSKNYEAKEGSTVLNFKTDYLNTLKVGTHKLRFEYTDGSAETTFTITKAEQTSNQTKDTPKKTTGTKATGSQTGDETAIGWFLGMLVASGGLIVLLVGMRRRRRS